MTTFSDRLSCLLWGHRFFVKQEFGPVARRVQCERCDGDWAMNDEIRAFVPWDDDFVRMYELLGHRVLK